MPYQKTPREIEQAYQNALAALRSSCRAFDAGEEWEAPRIAASIHMLCHDRGQTVGLLTQKDYRNSLSVISTVDRPHPDNLVVSHDLVSVQFGPDGISYIAPLDRQVRPVKRWKFTRWWNDEVIAAGPQMAWSITRQELIRSVRDQDGGGHVDAKLTNEAYIELSRTAHWIRQMGEQEPEDMMGLEHHSVRQIAWELVASLEEAGLA